MDLAVGRREHLQRRPDSTFSATLPLSARVNPEVQSVRTALIRYLPRAFAEHSLGHAALSQRALDEVIAGYGHFAAYQIGPVHAWRGELDRAFEWLDKAAAVHDGGLNSMKIDPLLRNLHGDPRYAALLRKMKRPTD